MNRMYVKQRSLYVNYGYIKIKRAGRKIMARFGNGYT